MDPFRQRSTRRKLFITLGAGALAAPLVCFAQHRDKTTVRGTPLPTAKPVGPKSNGPLAGLPSKAGAHIAQIKALGNNQWLKLPPAAGDPQFDPPRQGTVRSWTTKACYDPALGGALITGEGAHGFVYKTGHYSDDVVFYDLYANRWIFVYPGTHMPTLKSKMESGDYKVDEDQLGVLADRDGGALPIAPISGHGAHNQSWDPVARKFVWFGSTFTYFFESRPDGKASADLFRRMRKEKGLPDIYGTFWIYDAVVARFRPVSKAQLGDAGKLAEVGRLSGHQVIQYVDSKKMHLYPGDRADYWLDLAAMKMTVRPIATGEPRLVVGTGQHSGCYDPKRDRVYVGGGGIFTRQIPTDTAPGENFLYYDVKADKWVKPDPRGRFPLFWDVSTAFAVYDTVGDRLVITLAQQRTNRKKEGRVIYVYDPEKNEFEEQIPVPAEFPIGFGHAFFCPDLNVHLFNVAARDNSVGEWWAWRYKRL